MFFSLLAKIGLIIITDILRKYFVKVKKKLGLRVKHLFISEIIP